MFETWLTAQIAAWGLPAILVGAFVEGDAVGFLGGVLVHRGLFSFYPVVAAVALGAFVWDQTMFQIGMRAIDNRRLARLRNSAVMAKVRGAVARNPIRAAAGFRFIYGLRTVSPLALGASGLPIRTFVVVDAIAVVIWAHLVCGFGYGLGRAIEAMAGRLALHQHLILATALAAGVIAVMGLWHRRRRQD